MSEDLLRLLAAVGLPTIIMGIAWTAEYLSERYAIPVLEARGWPVYWKPVPAWIVAGALVFLLRADFVSPIVASFGGGWGQPYDAWCGLIASAILIGVGSNGLHELLVKFNIGNRAAKTM